MANNIILERLAKLRRTFQCDFLDVAAGMPTGIAAFDGAVLKVAMAVAALDGNVTEAELGDFERQAKECRGYTEESAKTLFHEGLRAAGYIELAARTLSEDELLAVFLDEVGRIMPGDFFDFRADEIRQAFVSWVAMALADGDFSSVERRAIDAFAAAVSGKRDEKWGQLRSLSPSFAIAYGNEAVKNGTDSILDAKFFERAEAALRRLAEDEPEAAEDLKNLVLNG